MAAGGEAGDRHGAVGGYGDAVSGKAVKAHLVGDGGAGHGDGAAFLRLKAVGCPLVVKVIENVVLGIQCGGLAIQAIHDGVCLNGGTICPHGHHEHTGKLRPDGGHTMVLRIAGLALHMGHGVIGHQDDGRAGLVAGNGGNTAVIAVGRNGHDVAVIAIFIDHAVVYIWQGNLRVYKALNSLPVAEYVQIKCLPHIHIFISLLVDSQIHVAQIINVFIKTVYGILSKAAVTDVQVIGSDGKFLRRVPLAKGPVGHAIRVLHADEVMVIIQIAVGRNHRQGECGAHAVGVFSDRRSLRKLISPVVAEGTGADGRALGRIHSDSGRGRDRCIQLNSAFCLRPRLAHCSSHIIGGLVSYGGKDSLDGIALDKNTGGAGGAPVSGGACLGLAVHAVGAHHLVGDGIIRTIDPAAVRGIDPIGPAKGDGGGVLRHGDNDAAVVLAGFIVALNPVVADRQLHPGVLQATVVAVSHGILAGQQVHIALDAAGIAIQLQGCQLGAVQARQIHGGHGDLLDLGGGVEQGINLRILVVHSGEIAGKAIGHGEGGLALFIGNSAVNDGDIAGLGIHPAQLGPLQGLGRSLQLGRSLVAVAFHGVEACDGSGDLLTHIHLGGSIHPGVVIGISILVTHDIKVHHVAIEQRGIGDHGAVVANTIVGRGAVIGIAAVDIEAAGVGLNAENLGDPAAAAHIQILPGCFLGKCITEGQLVSLDQGVQGGHSLQCIGKAVFLGFKGGNLHLLRRMEIAARCLGAEHHLHGSGSRLLHSDGILLRLFGFAVHAGPGGIAALHGDDGAVRHGDLRRALILRAVHAGADLEVLVAGGGRHHHAADIGGQLQRVAVGVLIEGGRQLAGTEGQGLDGVVTATPAAAQVIAKGAGVHDADLIAGFQLSGSHGKGVEALVGKPVVEGAHPAGL